jgi:hypothetical protein
MLVALALAVALRKSAPRPTIATAP